MVRDASTNVRATVFDCAMLPVPKSAAAAPKKAKSMASTFATDLLGTPRVM